VRFNLIHFFSLPLITCVPSDPTIISISLLSSLWALFLVFLFLYFVVEILIVPFSYSLSLSPYLIRCDSLPYLVYCAVQWAIHIGTTSRLDQQTNRLGSGPAPQVAFFMHH
jgi:hypothetical protein